MNNWIDGFFMAWGMFLAIPCPLHRWNENARCHMLSCLPLVGLIVGIVWCGSAYLLRGCPVAIRALVLCAVPWLMTGFLHLDGYMDVCDAILSRCDLATRQKILKDSHCGAFAVICIALLILAQWCAFHSSGEFHPFTLLLIPVASRCCASIAVSLLPPMGSSQYAAMKSEKAFLILPILLFAATLIVAWLLCRSIAPLMTAIVYWLGVWHGYRQLGGMNGDISGFALTIAELAGVMEMVLWI